MARMTKPARSGYLPERFRGTGKARIAIVLATALAVAALGPPTGAPAAPASPADRVRVIVELAGPPALAAATRSDTARSDAAAPNAAWDRAAERAAALRRDHHDLRRQASHAGVDVDVIHELTAAYNGMAVEVPASEVDQLATLRGVRAVHDDTLYEHTLDDSVPLVGAPDVWERTDLDGQPVTGKGVVVAVVDSGVDYTHPDLGGGFGPGHKVVAGHDFVNDDADPMDDSGHGTHVAGIVAADGKVRGVAPDATLTAYKVIDQFGSGQLSDILAGLDAAVAPDNPHRADVVNLSLSGPGDGSDPLSAAADQAADAGVVVVAAAGNIGPFPQTVTSPAAADGVLAVGASISGVMVPRARMVEPAQQDLRAVRQDFSADPPAAPRVLDVVDIGFGDPGSYDVTGAAVLISTFFGDDQLAKAMHAEERGAAAAFFYSPDFWGSVGDGGGTIPLARPVGPGPANSAAPPPTDDAFPTGIGDDGRLDTLVAMVIPGASAATLQAHGDQARVEITGVDATDEMADFSSRGPTGLFGQKPDLVAPGVEILSTLPDGAHGRASGTSMAAPHVAGAAALVRQLHPDWDPTAVNAALTGSAHRLDDAGPLDQGAGRLDVAAAADADVHAAPTALSFGLADLSGDDIDRTRTLTLRNRGDDPAALTLSVEPRNDAGAELTVEPSTVRLGAGETAEVEVRIRTAIPDADTDVSGWVTVDDGTRTQSVPYLLAVRHLGVHVTPDPAVPDTQTSVFIASPADLAEPPAVEVRCPGLAPQRQAAEPFGTRFWRATVRVADPGVCRVTTTGTAASRYGSPTLTGAGGYEVVVAPDRGSGIDRWQSIGPNAESGRMAFNITPNANQAAVVPLADPTAFVSSDRMQSWRELRTMPMAGGTPVSVSVPREKGGELYVAVDGGGDGSYQGRIMHTDDAGKTWQIVPGLDERLQHVAVDATGDTLAVGTRDDRLLITRDDGATWTTVPSPSNFIQDLHWVGPDLYIGTLSDGLVVVRDAAGPNPSDPVVLFRPGILGFADNVTGDADTLVVSTWPIPSVYVSHDDGATFEQVLQINGISFLDMELVDDDIYALQGDRNLWIGRDEGAEWETWGEPVRSSVEFDVAPSPWSEGGVFVSASSAGIFAADQPGEFRRVGVPSAWVYDLAIAESADGEALIAGTGTDTHRTTAARVGAVRPGDIAWDSSGGEGRIGVAAQFVQTSPTDSSVVFKLLDGIGQLGILRSEDGGATWEELARPSGRPFALLVHPGDPDRIYASYAIVPGDEGLVVSTDGGDTWRKVNHGRTFGVLAGDPTDPDRIWAGESFGPGRNGLWLSEDGGLSFRRLSDLPVTAIAVDPQDPDRLVIGGRGLSTSSDGGETLVRADHVDLDMWVNDLEFAPDGDRVYAAAGSFFDDVGALKGGRGVLVSGDRGASWESFSAGLANPNVTSLAFDRSGRYLYAGIGGGSVHRIKLSDD